MIVLVAFAVLWLPIRWLRPGLSIYAVGSNRNAAYLSGIGVARTRVGAYLLGGVFAGLAGLALTATSGIGDPNSGSTTPSTVWPRWCSEASHCWEAWAA